MPGDVPLNLTATSLMTHAYMYTGEKKYRQWVQDYLQRLGASELRSNGGIMPDNIGPSGRIGERMDGKWWGGYYGWRWPHGAWIILESTLIAGCNATLLTGDPGWLDLHRSQGDLLWSLRREEGGKSVVPARYGDRGWFDYRPLKPRPPCSFGLSEPGRSGPTAHPGTFPGRGAVADGIALWQGRVLLAAPLVRVHGRSEPGLSRSGAGGYIHGNQPAPGANREG